MSNGPRVDLSSSWFKRLAKVTCIGIGEIVHVLIPRRVLRENVFVLFVYLVLNDASTLVGH